MVGVRVQNMIHSSRKLPVPKGVSSHFCARHKKSVSLIWFLSFLLFFAVAGGGGGGLFLGLFHLCLCLCASFPVSLIVSVWEIHTNTMSPKHERLGSLCLGTWQWKQWYPLPLVRAESCGGHRLACLPSGQLGYVGQNDDMHRDGQIWRQWAQLVSGLVNSFPFRCCLVVGSSSEPSHRGQSTERTRIGWLLIPEWVFQVPLCNNG